MANVELESIRKVYPDGHVGVVDASFEVADGERLVLVGPSGCGKSTLLRMIAGLESISAGTLRIGGRVVNDLPPKDRDIAMVFQSYALYPHMSVAENLSFALRLRNMPSAEIEQRVAKAATMLGLADMLQRKPSQLSGGQRQRVALGRALVREPQVFLLDEPLSNLDAKLRAGMRAEIARIHAQFGATMIYVTHDQIEAMTLGQRIVVLKDGQIQQIDTPMALYERPANLFVATFLGSPAMNTISGRLQAAEGLMLDAGNGELLKLGELDVPAAWLGRDLHLGVRPEHLFEADTPAASSFEATVEMVEPVGNEVFVTLRRGALSLVARMPPDRLPALGDTLSIGLRPDKLLLFDARSTERLQP